MLALTFSIGDDRYALDARQIVEIVPLVKLKRIPTAARHVAGLFNYRGQTVPVIDLSALCLGQTARASLTTRIILVEYPAHGTTHTLGLMAEQVTEATRRSDDEFQAAGVSAPEAPFLGGVSNTTEGLLQLVEISKLLPAEVRDSLFNEAVQAAS